MTFILPSFGASAIAAVPGGGGGSFTNTYSLEYDATDDGARVNTPITLSNSSAWTISMWVKMVIPGTQVDTDDSSTFNNNATQYFRVLHQNTGWYATNGPYWYFEIGNSGAMYVQYKYDAGPDFANWVHVAYVHDGSANYKIFLNGVQQTTTGSTHSGASDFYIDYVYGRSGTAQIGSFKHDELAIFNNDQSSNISAIYNNGVAGDLSSYSANLTHWYRMEEGSGSTVSNGGSASSSDLNLQNSPTFSTDVPFNYYSVDFDGSDDYAKVTGLSLSGATSFSLWWNGQEATTNTTFPLLHQDSSNIFVDIGASMFRVYLYDGTNGGYIYRQHSFASPTQGQWYHFGITYDGTTNGSGLKTYIDGSLTGSGAVSGTFNSFNTQGSKPLGIGARLTYAHSGVYASQLIDEVAIFNSELSATNISDIYNSGVPTDIGTNGLNLSPIAWWRMEEGSGTSVVNTANSGTYDLGLFNTDGSGPTFSTNVPT